MNQNNQLRGELHYKLWFGAKKVFENQALNGFNEGNYSQMKHCELKAIDKFKTTD